MTAAISATFDMEEQERDGWLYGYCPHCHMRLHLAVGYAIQQGHASIQYVTCTNEDCDVVGRMMDAPWIYGYCVRCHEKLAAHIDDNSATTQEIVCGNPDCVNNGLVVQSNIEESAGDEEYGKKPTCHYTKEKVGSAASTMRETMHDIRQDAHNGSFSLFNRDERREMTENDRVLDGLVRSSMSSGQRHPSAKIVTEELWRHNDRKMHLPKDKLDLLIAHCQKILSKLEVAPREQVVNTLNALLIRMNLPPIEETT